MPGPAKIACLIPLPCLIFEWAGGDVDAVNKGSLDYDTQSELLGHGINFRQLRRKNYRGITRFENRCIDRFKCPYWAEGQIARP
jgi:hypothetical protein